MSISKSIIEKVLNYFGITEKKADSIKKVIELVDFEENDKEVTISCKKGFTITINK